MNTYICIYIYIYTYSYVFMNIYTYIYVRMYTYIYIYIYTCVCVCMCVCVCAYSYVCVCLCVCVCLRVCIRAWKHTCNLKYRHRSIHVNPCTLLSWFIFAILCCTLHTPSHSDNSVHCISLSLSVSALSLSDCLAPSSPLTHIFTCVCCTPSHSLFPAPPLSLSERERERDSVCVCVRLSS